MLLLAQRVILGAVALVSVLTADNLRLADYPWPANTIRGGEPWSLILTSWNHWDAVRYHDLADQGYAAMRQSGALYPLFPFLSKVLSIPLGGQILAAELIVTSVAFVVAMRLIYSLAHLEADAIAGVVRWAGRRRLEVEDPARRQRFARLTVLLVALFPTGFFFFAPYTEALFLALTVGSLWCARTGRWWWAGAAGLLAALTRFPGGFLVLPLSYEYLRQRGVVSWVRKQGGQGPGLNLVACFLPLVGMAMAPLIVAISRGWGGSTPAPYFWQAVMYWGNRVSGQRPASEALGQFGYQVVPPWEALGASWSYVRAWVADPPSSLPSVEAFNLACMLGFTALGLLALRRLPIMYSLYIWPSLAILFTRQMGFSPLMSVSRYLLVVAPCFIVLAMLLFDRRRITLLWLVVGAALQVLMLWYHVRVGFVA